MPAECIDAIDEMPHYSYDLPFDPHEWLKTSAVTPKTSRQNSPRDVCSIFDWIDESSQRRNSVKEDDLQIELQRAVGMLNDFDADTDERLFTLETLDRASAFLRAQSAKFRKMYGEDAPVPNIGVGPDASVDLHWKGADWELLVNIPEDTSKFATFYGDDYGSQKIKGSFDPQILNYGIIMWLMKN